MDGNYTEWTDWTACDKTCGAGFMTRWRACSNPAPQFGGRDCSLFGPDAETKTCQVKDYCPGEVEICCRAFRGKRRLTEVVFLIFTQKSFSSLKLRSQYSFYCSQLAFFAKTLKCIS